MVTLWLLYFQHTVYEYKDMRFVGSQRTAHDQNTTLVAEKSRADRSLVLVVSNIIEITDIAKLLQI